jgi:Flp pilus assembly protein TadB
MKKYVFVLFLFAMLILSSGLYAQQVEDKAAASQAKKELKMDAKSEKQILKDEKAEKQRIKNFETSLKNYDKALNKKHDAEVKLAKENLK